MVLLFQTVCTAPKTLVCLQAMERKKIRPLGQCVGLSSEQTAFKAVKDRESPECSQNH